MIAVPKVNMQDEQEFTFSEINRIPKEGTEGKQEEMANHQLQENEGVVVSKWNSPTGKL